jgi:hypothetical protein
MRLVPTVLEKGGLKQKALERDGPNHVSLMTARLNFLAFGAAEREALPHVRSPREDDVRVRIVTIEDPRRIECGSRTTLPAMGGNVHGP